MPTPYINLARLYLELGLYKKGYETYKSFTDLVSYNLARHNAASLWLGLQLADFNEDLNAEASYELQLKNRFPESDEYQEYLMWVESN